MPGYYQLIEGHTGGFMFVLRADNHETILESRLYWSRQAALDAVAAVRECSQHAACYQRRQTDEGMHCFELQDLEGRLLGRGPPRRQRSRLAAGIASVQRNAPSDIFRGLVRRALVPG